MGQTLVGVSLVNSLEPMEEQDLGRVQVRLMAWEPTPWDSRELEDLEEVEDLEDQVDLLVQMDSGQEVSQVQMNSQEHLDLGDL